MLKVLLIDDESIVRQGLRQAVDWASLNLTVVGEADSVPAAMNLARAYQPDIFLCDIRLPGEDGFAFIDQVKKVLPHSQIIILSGYGDQAYMLNAIRHGVCAYLLKPSSVSEICEALNRASAILYEQRQKDQDYQKNSQFLYENTDTLKMHFFDKLLTQNMSPARLASYASSLDLTLKGPFYLLLLTAHPSMESMWDYINKLAFSLRDYSPIISPLPKNELMAVILNSPDGGISSGSFITGSGSPDNDISGGASPGSSIPAAFMQACHTPAFPSDSPPLCITPLCKSPLMFVRYFRKMEDFISRSMWFNPGQVYPIESLDLPPFPQKQLRDLEHTFALALKNEEGNAASKAFNKIMDLLESHKTANSKFQEEISYLLRISCTIRNVKRPLPLSIPLSMDGVTQLFFKYLGDFTQFSSKGPGKSLAQKALDYIQLHYNESLTLDGIAEELFISPTYLSHLIKEKTDRGFQDWLHYFRIQKACGLLKETDMTTNSISEAVGYNSYKLFSEHMKKETGMTASEYRFYYKRGI
ncbi:response regulator [Clostridium sp. MCC353]|uniref:response regulator transcription factor n=1 Tax=Clostridium sp. MCC353 TaxID=2592646 RepID=UPI001C009D2D|nr:response regulator [Clostridium sp. MCC353]MBT9776921.1 response regulator [Clostridium sp. MCC353]